MSPRRAATAIGLDISTGSIKAAELQIARGEPILSNLGMVNLPEGVIKDGEIEDPVTLSNMLKELWSRTGLKYRRVILGVANQKVIVRPIEIPYMEAEELESALRFQVQEFIPIPVEDAILDFDIIEEFMTSDDQRMLSVLLVAAYKDMVQSFIDTVRSAGLTAIAIDLKAFALPRALLPRTLPGLSEAGEEAEAICILNVGTGTTNMVIVKDGVPRFARILLRGGDDFTRALMDRLDLDAGEAEQIKMGLAVNEDAAALMRQEVYRFVGEVRRSLDYYVTQTGERNLRKVLLAGEGSRMINLPQELNQGLRLPVEIGRSFQNVELGKLPFSPEELADLEPSVAVSVGLALREVME